MVIIEDLDLAASEVFCDGQFGDLVENGTRLCMKTEGLSNAL